MKHPTAAPRSADAGTGPGDPSATPPATAVLRRRSLAAAGLLWPLAAAHAAPPPACPAWPLWDAFWQRFVQADGRVIDDQHETRYTTSEGQAYVLFFSLVANDRARFDTVLRWAETHLAAGDLTARLPGWRWGRRDDGAWTLVDANAASDADLWLAYTLFEAARLWQVPAYRRTADALLTRVQATEMVRLPGQGWMLLPGPQGFQTGPAQWRLNPSYVPLQQLRYFAGVDPRGPWQSVAATTLAMLQAAAPLGFVPDWVEYSEARGWHATAQSPAMGSYDAIRTYLWAGMLHPRDPDRARWLQLLGGMRRWLEAGHAAPPQQVQTHSGTGNIPGPPGFSAALLPYLEALGTKGLLQAQRARVRQAAHPTAEGASGRCGATPYATTLVGDPPTYYDQVLTLFGQGAMEKRYGFAADGALWTPWQGRR